MALWSYEKVQDGYGYLKGPNGFKLSVYDSVEVIGSLLFGITEVKILCSDDHAASVIIKREDDGKLIKVSTEQDILMEFYLDYHESFSLAVEEMVDHFEPSE